MIKTITLELVPSGFTDGFAGCDGCIFDQMRGGCVVPEDDKIFDCLIDKKIDQIWIIKVDNLT